jgi:predicted PurR-regulated permease PerM
LKRAFFLVLLAGATALVILVARTAERNSDQIRKFLGGLDERLKQLPALQDARIAEMVNLDRLAAPVQRAGRWLLERTAELAGNIARSPLLFFVYLYCLYFLMRDGEAALSRIPEAIPLSRDDRRAVTDKFLSVTRATLKSTFIVGAIQGVLGGLLFFALGIGAPVLGGVAVFGVWGIFARIFRGELKEI